MRSNAALRPILNIGVWVGLGACLIAIAADPLSQWDFNVYYAAAHALAAGANPYASQHPHPGLNGALIFQYPPLTLYLFRWTTPFKLATAKLLWLGSKLVAVALLAWIWRRDFERVDLGWPIALFIALGFNASLLHDVVSGNISTFEQLGLWFGLGLLLRERPYAAAAMLACVAQFKLLPVAFLGVIPLLRPRDGWKPLLAGGAMFLGLLALNQALSPSLTHDYLGLFGGTNVRMDDRGINNPSSLSLFRDLIDLSAYAPGLPYNRVSGTIAYEVYLFALLLVMLRALWNLRAAFRHAEPRVLVYLGCALYAVAAPRMKDYSYILMLMPTLYVLRDLGKHGIPANYLLLGVALMLCAQPQQTTVPGLTPIIYLLQAYLPLFMAGAVLIYLLRALPRSGAGRGTDDEPRTGNGEVLRDSSLNAPL